MTGKPRRRWEVEFLDGDLEEAELRRHMKRRGLRPAEIDVRIDELIAAQRESDARLLGGLA